MILFQYGTLTECMYVQVIFSQSSELLERESSMASSLEEVSGAAGDTAAGAPPADHFGVFKDFDFLEYESESIEVSTVMYRYAIGHWLYIYLCQRLYNWLITI